MAEQTNAPEWGWPDSLDAVIAAPQSHHILFENDSVRVVEVVIPPGEREPVHTHRWPSVMMVDRSTQIRYYDEDGALAFESSPREVGAEADEVTPRTSWMEPEGPHAVENIDTTEYHAIRVELKEAHQGD